MLTKRIIPCLDVNAGRVVKGVHFLQLRDAGDPVEVARRYEADGADELVSSILPPVTKGRDIILDVVRRVSEQLFMPFTVGGGIRTLDDATRLIQSRCRKSQHQFRRREESQPGDGKSPASFGRCATVVNIDPRRVTTTGREVWEVHINGGRVPTGLEAVAWAKRVEELGAGEIVLTSMDADGTKNGYDLPMLEAVANSVGIPVVASGGAGHPSHLMDAFRVGADAALAASIFHYNEYSIPATKRFLAEHGGCRSSRLIDIIRSEAREVRPWPPTTMKHWLSISACPPKARKEPEVNKLFRAVMKHEGSDLHLKAGLPPMMRHKGVIKKMDLPPLMQEHMEKLLTPILSDKAKVVFEETGGADFAHVIGNDECRFRVNLLKQRGKWSLVARRVSNKIPTFEGLAPAAVDRKNWCHYDQGLIILAGVTGSGQIDHHCVDAGLHQRARTGPHPDH